MAPLERHEIVVDDGATLEVFLGGSGDPVVCRTHPFEPMVADRAASWPWEPTMGRLIAVNPRGLGGSSPDADPRDFTFVQHTADLETVRRQLGIDRWTLWGESGGAVVALLTALRDPGAIAGLILAYMGASGPAIAADARSVLSPQHPANRVDPGAGRPAVLAAVDIRLADATWRPLGTDTWLLGVGERPLVVCPEGGDARMWAAFEQFATGFDVRARLHELIMPTLVVAGRQDALVPLDHVDDLVAGLPHADSVVLSESGHADVDRQTADGARYRVAMDRFLGQLRAAA